MEPKQIQDELNSHLEQLLAEPFARHNQLGDATAESIERTFEEIDELVSSGSPPEGWDSLAESYERCRALFCQVLMDLEMLGWGELLQESLNTLRSRLTQTPEAQTRQSFEDILNSDPLGEKNWSWEPEDPANPPEEFLRQNAEADDPTLIREAPRPAADLDLWAADEPETKTDVGAASPVSWEAHPLPQSDAGGETVGGPEFPTETEGYPDEEEELLPPPAEQLAPMGMAPPPEPPPAPQKIQPPPEPPARKASATEVPPASAPDGSEVPLAPPAPSRRSSLPGEPVAPPPMMDIGELSGGDALSPNTEAEGLELDLSASQTIAPPPAPPESASVSAEQAETPEPIADLPPMHAEAEDPAIPEQTVGTVEDHPAIADFFHSLELQGTAPFSPEAARRYRSVAHLFALEKALDDFLRQPLHHLERHRRRAIEPWLSGDGLPATVTEAIEKLASAHPDRVPEGGVPYQAISNGLHYLGSATRLTHLTALEAGILVFFFGHESRFGEWETHNLLQLPGMDARDAAEFFFRCLRVQRQRHQVFDPGAEIHSTDTLAEDHQRLRELMSRFALQSKVA